MSARTVREAHTRETTEDVAGETGVLDWIHVLVWIPSPFHSLFYAQSFDVQRLGLFTFVIG